MTLPFALAACMEVPEIIIVALDGIPDRFGIGSEDNNILAVRENWRTVRTLLFASTLSSKQQLGMSEMPSH